MLTKKKRTFSDCFFIVLTGLSAVKGYVLKANNFPFTSLTCALHLNSKLVSVSAVGNPFF